MPHDSRPAGNARAPRRGSAGSPEQTREPPRAGPVRDPVRELIEHQLRSLVLAAPFPCLGAKAAIRTDSYVFRVYQDLCDPAEVSRVAEDLRHFTRHRHELGPFYSYVASFLEPKVVTDEAEWDRLVWSFLQRLHDLDHDGWDERWSDAPEDADFAFSFAGCGQLVVALYPGASRFARRFAWPTLVFNPPEQDRANFPEDEAFFRFQELIRRRDARLQGTVNPALPATPEQSQAPGFSGAPVDGSWRCQLVVRRDAVGPR
jgi:uncharacterized protein